MRDYRCALTRVEVVLLVIILMLLVGLGLPLIQSARVTTRRDMCANNMRNIAAGLITLHDSNQAFPGYANVLNNRRVTWVVPLLPYLERNDLHQIWKDREPVESSLVQEATRLHMDLLICPSSDRWDGSDPLSDVVNCGSARTANDFFPPIDASRMWVEDVNSGVFFNRARADFYEKIAQPDRNPPADAFDSDAGPVVTLDFLSLHDGTTNTLMLAENLHAGNWATDPTLAGGESRKPFQSEFQIRQQTGFVWFVTGRRNNDLPAAPNSLFNEAGVKPNALAKEIGFPVPTEPYPVAGSKPPTGGLAYSRPSSNHHGGVNVMFCDCHYRFISEDIDYRVYTALMTPNDRGVITAAGEPPSRQLRRDGIMSSKRRTFESLQPFELFVSAC